jgi:hypothetical protein
VQNFYWPPEEISSLSGKHDHGIPYLNSHSEFGEGQPFVHQKRSILLDHISCIQLIMFLNPSFENVLIFSYIKMLVIQIITRTNEM